MVEICHPYVELITNHPLLIQQKRKSSFGPAALQHGFDQKSTSISLVCLTIRDKVGKMKTNGTIAYCWLAEVFCTCWEIQDIHPNRQWTEHFSNCDCAGQQSVPRGVRGWGQQDRVATLVSDIWVISYTLYVTPWHVVNSEIDIKICSSTCWASWTGEQRVTWSIIKCLCGKIIDVNTMTERELVRPESRFCTFINRGWTTD